MENKSDRLNRTYPFVHLVPDIVVILRNLSLPFGLFGDVVIVISFDSIVVALHEFLVLTPDELDLLLILAQGGLECLILDRISVLEDSRILLGYEVAAIV